MKSAVTMLGIGLACAGFVMLEKNKKRLKDL